MEEIVIRALNKLHNDKKVSNIEPNHISEIELLKLINKGVKITLNKLVSDGKIKKVDTMNGYHYTVI